MTPSGLTQRSPLSIIIILVQSPSAAEMLRSLISNLLRNTGGTLNAKPVEKPKHGAGSVVFIGTMGEPLRIMPQMQLYSDHASLRLRAFVPMLRLAPHRPVHLIPATYVVEYPDLAPLQPVETVVVTNYSTGEVGAAPATFAALIANIARLRRDVRLFADLCDNYAAMGDHLGLPILRRYQEGLAEHCVLTVPCAALAEELAPFADHDIHVIEDPFESPRMGVPRASPGDPIRLCWFGTLGTVNAEPIVRGLQSVLAALAGRAVQLDFVTHQLREGLATEIGARLCQDHRALTFHFVPWSLDATWQAIDGCDFVLLPQDHRDPWGRVKSHNRLVEAIRGGRLAIASPIPSYLELGDFAWVGEDIGAGIAWALANPEEAAARVSAGQRYIHTRFAPDRIAGRWERLILGAAASMSQDGPAGLPADADAQTPATSGDMRLNP